MTGIAKAALVGALLAATISTGRAGSLHVFGDSNSDIATNNCQMASLPSATYEQSQGGLCWPHIVAALRGLTLDNHAVSGAQAADQADPVFAAPAPAAGDRSVIFIGENDEAVYGTTPALLDVFKTVLAAESYWVAGTHTTMQAGACVLSGFAANVYIYGGTVDAVSTTTGSTATCPFSGGTFALGYTIAGVSGGSGGQFTVSIDGAPQGTFNNYAGADFTTQNNRPWGPALLLLSGLGSGSHTAVITVVSAAGKSVYLDFIGSGSNGVPLSLVTLPFANGYPGHGSAANVTAYNTGIMAVQAQLAGIGMAVDVVDANTLIAPASDIGTGQFHLNPWGQLLLGMKVVRQWGGGP